MISVENLEHSLEWTRVGAQLILERRGVAANARLKTPRAMASAVGRRRCEGDRRQVAAAAGGGDHDEATDDGNANHHHCTSVWELVATRKSAFS